MKTSSCLKFLGGGFFGGGLCGYKFAESQRERSLCFRRQDEADERSIFPYPHQLHSLWNGSNDHKIRLIALFSKTLFTSSFLGKTVTTTDKDRVENMVTKQDDEAVYQFLRTATDSKEKIRGLTDAEKAWSLKRGKKRADEIFKACKFADLDVDTNMSTKSYLDIGCGDGSITIALGRLICGGDDNASNRIHGIDYLERESKLQHTGFTFHGQNSLAKLPFKDGSQDVVTCLQVLHHSSNIAHTLNEINRVLKPGGILIIREHDTDGPEIEALCDIEHGLWRVLRQTRMTDSQDAYFKTNYLKNGFSSLDQELRSRGLLPTLQTVNRDRLKNPTNCGYLIAKKGENMEKC